MIKPTDKIAIAIVALCVGLAVLLPLPSSISRSELSTPNLVPGQSATLLPGGRWLILGGQSVNGLPLPTAEIWDANSGVTTPLTTGLQHRRAYHSATVLPDGTIFIFGGVGSDGQVLSTPELFNPRTRTFELLPTDCCPSPRSKHTATLLTDGRIVISGGVGANGEVFNTASLFDPRTQSPVIEIHSLSSPRQTTPPLSFPMARFSSQAV